MVIVIRRTKNAIIQPITEHASKHTAGGNIKDKGWMYIGPEDYCSSSKAEVDFTYGEKK